MTARPWSARDRADVLAAVGAGRYESTDLEKAPLHPFSWPLATQEAERARVAALDPRRLAIGHLLRLCGIHRDYESKHTEFSRLLRAGETYGWLAPDKREEMAVQFDGYAHESKLTADRWYRLAVRVRDEGLPP